ncbi:MAG: PQQ-dependent sugar dehydrogenase [Thermoanaerobaculia bacterium]
MAVTQPPAARAPADGTDAQPAVTGLKRRRVGVFSNPTYVTAPPGDRTRLFVVEQGGTIRVVQRGRKRERPYLDIRDRVQSGGERGLLSMAFAPNYRKSRRFYVHYTDNGGDIKVVEFKGRRNRAFKRSARIVLTQEHSTYGNHNGGQLQFGPDGRLYIGLGDGGGSGDPFRAAQSLDSHLGKILRINPRGKPRIPRSNPFRGRRGARPAVYSYGLRNPWRFSFDRLTHDLWTGDVGQGAWEEIDLQAASSAGGENYGWDVLEGAHCFENDPGGDGSCADFLNGGSVLPVLEYDHGLGCSVTGGYRYRGRLEPELDGIYFYADYCSGRIWGARPQGEGAWASEQLLDAAFNIATLGESEAGEVHVAAHAGTGQGTLYRIAAVPGTGQPVLVPAALEADAEPVASNGNGVFEPGESVEVAPAWRNVSNAPRSPVGNASHLTGPRGGEYTVESDAASYGTLQPGETASCLDTGVCYRMHVAASAARPARHWDATFDEVLSNGTAKTWPLHIGGSFTDVPRSSPFYRSIETLLHRRVTGGCNAARYCPAAGSSRAQMAVFVLKAVEGGDYLPPVCVQGEELFADVPATNPFCRWIEELANRGVVAGCGGGDYCPNGAARRADMAVFLLKTLEGPGYTPPACDGIFADVPCPSLFADWIEDLVDRGITAGCGGGNYCPANPVSRDQMAVFLSKTFGLSLYGP